MLKMPDSKRVKEMIEKIESNKEVLSVMPKNNEKNIEKYLSKIQELKNEYENYKQTVLNILNDRYDREIQITKNPDIDNLQSRLDTIEKTLCIINDIKTSYEKMELDKIIYRIRKYYKENLENVNNQILLAINKFANVGIDLTLADFNYSIYVKEYMEMFFKELEEGNINSDNIANKFEEIYWKCPDIIIHIELNIRNIYLKNQVAIDKYFSREKNSLLKQWSKMPNEIMSSYLALKRQKIEKEKTDKFILLDSFISGKLNIKNYTSEKIKSNCLKFIPENILNDDTKSEEIEMNLFKFLNSLYEYRNYMKFNFILEDIKKYYKEKEKYKKVYMDTKKKIESSETKLRKINKKLQRKGLFAKKSSAKQAKEQNNLILEIKDMYGQLDLNKFYNKIYTELTDNATIYDVLKLASSYYNYLVECIIKKDKSIVQEDIELLIQDLNEFLENPYNTIINNVTILEEKDIAIIIKDRYKLLNFNIEIDDLNINNIDNLISTLEEIQIGFNIRRAELDVDNIARICEMNKILSKNRV